MGIRATSIVERNHRELLPLRRQLAGTSSRRLPGSPRVAWIQPAAAASDVYDEALAPVVSIAVAWPLPEPISILRGLACSATGIVTVKTPLSYLASMRSGSRPSPRNN